jgi:hypothetical protein
VSPWWRERLLVDLTPASVELTRFRRGLRPAVAHSAAYGAEVPGSGWAPALDVLRHALAEPRWQGAAVEVRISSHFVRFGLLPWSATLATDDERLAHARLEFETVHGARARAWSMRIDDAAPGGHAPVAAIDEALLQGLTEACRQAGSRLVSVAPRFAAAFNRQRARLAGARAGFVLLEPGRLTLALLARGAWARLSSVRTAASAGEALAAELQQALALGEVDGPGHLVVAAVGSANEQLPASVADWEVTRAQEPMLPARREAFGAVESAVI